MTTEQLSKMTPAEKNEAVCKILGWDLKPKYAVFADDPDYPGPEFVSDNVELCKSWIRDTKRLSMGPTCDFGITPQLIPLDIYHNIALAVKALKEWCINRKATGIIFLLPGVYEVTIKTARKAASCGTDEDLPIAIVDAILLEHKGGIDANP
jgi:hypothetical protein